MAALSTRKAFAAGCQQKGVARPVFVAAKPAARVGTCASRNAIVCQAAAVEAVSKADMLNKTYYPTGADAAAVTKPWYIIDAEGQTLGRLANLVATYIRGKNLATYTPSMDMGGYVIVINAEKVKVTGKKFTDKTYFSAVNGVPGSAKLESFKDLQKRLPERIIERAVRGMLPKGALGRDIRLHCKVYAGAKHPHEAQQPKDITKEMSREYRREQGKALLAELAKKA
jgi:large subunit ribosomal protein L13